MAERAGDPEQLGRVAVNRAVLARLAEGATRATDGVTVWSPDGWTMRTHPDVSEALEAAAAGRPLELRLVHGVATLVDPHAQIRAVGWGTSRVWLRAPGEPAVAGLPGWRELDAWRDDLGGSIRSLVVESADA